VGEQLCLDDIARNLGREQRLYRWTLLGHPQASDAPLGEVRYTQDGKLYLKKGENSWYPASGDPLGNPEMDAQEEKDVLCDTDAPSCVTVPRKGVFEVRGSETSDINILPAALHAQRALLYRTLAVCDAAEQSMNAKVSNPLTTDVIGGRPMRFTPFLGCAFGGKQEWQAAKVTVTERCRAIADALVQRERELLTMLIAYDASQRSLYQFAGGFDMFMERWRDALSGPIWQAVRILRWLPRIPCFLSSCDE
jgi:hypothetical protein